MNKRERLEKTVAGEATDRVPVAFWRHWPGDDQRPADLARSILDFQQRWDFDLIKVTPSSSYCIKDYGVEDQWVGHLEGTRQYTKRAVITLDDWTKLGQLDPTKGSLGAQLETLRQVKAGLDEDVPILHTIFNPLSQAKNIAGPNNLPFHWRGNPDGFKAGLETITENTLRYIDAVKDLGIVAGIFYAVQHASHTWMSRAEYEEFGLPYDQRILAALPDDWWFNMMHLHGDAPMFDLVADYPVQAINWHDRETSPSLAEGQQLFKGAVCGGLGRWDVHNNTPDEVAAQAKEAIEQTGSRRFILSTGCVLMTTSPKSNIRAARQVVE
jgi:uroporphyrinogen decarboxylase